MQKGIPLSCCAGEFLQIDVPVIFIHSSHATSTSRLHFECTGHDPSGQVIMVIKYIFKSIRNAYPIALEFHSPPPAPQHLLLDQKKRTYS